MSLASMSLIAWYDIPLALLAGLCFVLAWQDSRRRKRDYERLMNRRVEQALRADEDLGYLCARLAADLAERQAGARLVERCEPYGYSVRVPNQTRILRKVEA
jgi:hypothetical protein